MKRSETGRRLWRASGGASVGAHSCDYAGVAEREAAQPCKRGATGAAPHQRKDRIMKISARNQIKGTVKTVKEGAVNAVAIIKATDVMVAVD